MELLPGPRDRDGLPDSLRFWKTRTEETDPDETFKVGLIYGPSGCGKSSLVKAGLLPRLSQDVISVYVESTPDETESRFLYGLRKRFPRLDSNLSLNDTIMALRQGKGIPAGKKVLIVLDQFEQWLHANKDEQNTELVQVLRQCDGGRVQCIVMVRDDFWLAVSRLFRDLEVRLLEGDNSALVDLFDIQHARRVLTAFGRAFGKLPQTSKEMSADQKNFVKQSVGGLAEEGKVICVRLALFAEMMKGKEWIPATLQKMGGATGVGATFLEETFAASTAPPEHRLHQKAARAVLRELLPESGTDIKGCMRSSAELLEISGYRNRPQDFDDLIRILDGEIRLITPTDPEGESLIDESEFQSQTGQKYYQLTHDYLVHSLRDWLTGKLKETREGRAELKLIDTSATWNGRPENRFLPSSWETFNIRFFTNKKKWTDAQQKMMSKAGRVHLSRAIAAVLGIAALIVAAVWLRGSVVEDRNQDRADGLVATLVNAELTQVPSILRELSEYSQWTGPKLVAALDQYGDDSVERRNASLALLKTDPEQLPYLKRQLLRAEPEDVATLVALLGDHANQLVPDFWQVVDDNLGNKNSSLLQAASALAAYDADNEADWGRFASGVVDALVQQNPLKLAAWAKTLEPVSHYLLGPLQVVYRGDDKKRSATEIELATTILERYAAHDPNALAELVFEANSSQFNILFDKFATHGDIAITRAESELEKKAKDSWSEIEKDQLARRQANAAVALLRMDSADQVWPLFRHRPDPGIRSFLIHWLSPRGGNPASIISRYKEEDDVTIKRALLLCLGEFELAPAVKKEMTATLIDVYRSDRDPGLHGAAQWLLRQWGQGEMIADIDKQLQQSEEQLLVEKDSQRRWYVNSQNQTFVILETSTIEMGSPESELGRRTYERMHQRKVDRRFAISTKEVTSAQWRLFSQAHPEMEWKAGRDSEIAYVRTEDSPMMAMNWFEAAWYCNWLSEHEGIPEDQWCYEENEEGKFGDNMKAKNNFLELTGYRLPTEAEWEFACRAETKTSRYYGQTENLLANYAWVVSSSNNRSWPVASLKPNDFGLFDMLGNAEEWVYDRYIEYPPEWPAPKNEGGTIAAKDRRVYRGGSFNTVPSFVRSANRFLYEPTFRDNDLGFRPARTYHVFP